MVKTGWTAASILILLAGCASSPQAPLAANASEASAPSGDSVVAPKQKVAVYDKSKPKESNLHCTRFKPTGSHRLITRCVTQEQREVEEDAARNALIKATGPVLQAPADL